MTGEDVARNRAALERDARARTWIVIPAFNEASRLPATLRALAPYHNVVVVDDGSRDGTTEAARQHGAVVLRHVVNRGQGAALQTGIEYAMQQGAELVVTFDGDGQHDAEDIARLVAPVLSGAVDVTLGSRFLGEARDLPLDRWLILKLGIQFTRLFSWVRVTDTHNGLRALSGKAARVIRITQDRMAHASEILDEIRRHRLRYQEVPVTIRYSHETLAKGQGSWNALNIVWRLLIGRLLR